MRALACFLCLGAVLSAQELLPETLLLARIKLRAAENLGRLPNYTCLETIERSVRSAGSRKFELRDVLRMEVAFVDRKEMFAWPGSANFEEKELSKMVGGGAIGNGSFALHARSVFLSNAPTFSFAGERVLDGRSTVRYDYRVPRIQSGYQLRVPPVIGIVGYEGSFWVDAASLDLVRLDVKITDIPSQLPISSGSETLRYERFKIGEHEFLLPSQSELILVDLPGNESRNRIQFTNCRQFAGESVLSFADAPEGPVVAKSAPQKIVLPAGLDVDLRLENPIDLATSAIGDPVRALVAGNARRKGKVIIPKGAIVRGRIARMTKVAKYPDALWSIGLDFQTVEWDRAFASFDARLDPSIYGTLALGGNPIHLRRYRIIREQPEPDPRIGILFIRGENGKLAAGYRMIWRTEAPIEEIQ